MDIIPFRHYDESRLASNVLEMYMDNNFLVTHYNGEPEMWNTKPPLLIWIQVFFVHAIGFNELAMRIPVALFAFASLLLIFFYFRNYHKNYLLGLFAALILLSSIGYVSIHGVRTGDYDVPLSFFMLCYVIALDAFIHTSKVKFLYIFFAAITLGVFTKSVAALLFIPGIVIYLIISKRLFELIRNKNFWLGILISFICIISYYLLREMKNPGYLSAVMNNELGGRFLDALEGHKEPFNYYWKNLINSRYSYLIFLAIIGIPLGCWNENKRIRASSRLVTITACTFLLIISTAQTKLEWYDIPLYPLMSILVSISIYEIYLLISKRMYVFKEYTSKILSFLFIVLSIYPAYSHVFEFTYKPKHSEGDKIYYVASYFLKDALRGKHDLSGMSYIESGYHPHTSLYIKMLQIKGVDIGEKQIHDVIPSDTVIIHQFETEYQLLDCYNCKLLNTFEGVSIYQVISLKP